MTSCPLPLLCRLSFKLALPKNHSGASEDPVQGVLDPQMHLIQPVIFRSVGTLRTGVPFKMPYFMLLIKDCSGVAGLALPLLRRAMLSVTSSSFVDYLSPEDIGVFSSRFNNKPKLRYKNLKVGAFSHQPRKGSYPVCRAGDGGSATASSQALAIWTLCRLNGLTPE